MSTAAQQLSQWIENTHPEFFDYLLTHVTQARMRTATRQARLLGFGQDDTDITFDTGGDYAPSYSDADTIASSYSPAAVDIPTLSESDLSTPGLTTALEPSTGDISVSTDNSGSGLLSSLGSGISSAASSVANFLTSSQGLSDVTKLATAYFQVQNTQANAAVQTQILQAQAARAAAGQAPSPVSYGVSASGQLIPIYATGTPLTSIGGALVSPANMPAALVAAIQSGQSQWVTLPDGTTGYTIPSNMVGSLSSTQTLTSLLPWVALVIGGLLLAKELSR
jgi:hypothetical protein